MFSRSLEAKQISKAEYAREDSASGPHRLTISRAAKIVHEKSILLEALPARSHIEYDLSCIAYCFPKNENMPFFAGLPSETPLSLFFDDTLLLLSLSWTCLSACSVGLPKGFSSYIHKNQRLQEVKAPDTNGRHTASTCQTVFADTSTALWMRLGHASLALLLAILIFLKQEKSETAALPKHTQRDQTNLHLTKPYRTVATVPP